MKQRHRMLVQVTTLTLLVLGLAAAECWAVRPYTPVHPDPVLEPWRWTTFPELKGLGLWCMAEDKEGRMWFGVKDGVRIYDGVDWTSYTEHDGLLGNQVKALRVARDGSVYAGTDAGISRYKDGSWSRVFPAEGSLPCNVWDLIEASDGGVWAAMWRGALRLHQGSVTLYTTAGMKAAIQPLIPDVQLSIVPKEATPVRPWSEGAGVSLLKGFVTAVASGGPGERAGLELGDRIVKLDGRPFSGGLSGPAGTSVTLTVEREGLPEPFELSVTREVVGGTYPHFWVQTICEDRDGAMWFGVDMTGEIVRCDIVGTQPGDAFAWKLYTEADGLECGSQPNIIQTRDGTVWTASGVGKGVNRFDGSNWTTVRLGDVLGLPRQANTNNCILETRDGTVWVGGMGLLFAYRDVAWTAFSHFQVPVPRHYLWDLLEASDGALWMLSIRQEAVRLELGTSRTVTYEGLSSSANPLMARCGSRRRTAAWCATMGTPGSATMSKTV